MVKLSKDTCPETVAGPKKNMSFGLHEAMWLAVTYSSAAGFLSPSDWFLIRLLPIVLTRLGLK